MKPNRISEQLATAPCPPSRYRLHRDSDDGDWIARPNNGGDLGDMQEICTELNRLRNALQILIGDVNHLGHWIPSPCRRIVEDALANASDQLFGDGVK